MVKGLGRAHLPARRPVLRAVSPPGIRLERHADRVLRREHAAGLNARACVCVCVYSGGGGNELRV
jgi:hypothetical protein